MTEQNSTECTRRDVDSVPQRPPPWEKILWKQQPGYDDDHVPDSFLSLEKQRLASESSSHVRILYVCKKPKTRAHGIYLFCFPPAQGHDGPSIQALLKPEIAPQATIFTFIGLFILVFRALLMDHVQASQLNTLNLVTAMIMLGIAKWRRRRPRRQQQQQQQHSMDESTRAVHWLLPPFVLYIISPLLLSLTKASTSDSIWPLAGALFCTASVLGGFGENVGFGTSGGEAINKSHAPTTQHQQDYQDHQNHQQRRAARRGSVSELTLMDKSKR